MTELCRSWRDPIPPKAADLPAGAKQNVLSQIRDQIGSAQYDEFVNKWGEDKLIDFMLIAVDSATSSQSQTRTDLSALEAMDILGEASTGLPTALIFKEETLRRFKDLAKIESEAVQYAVQLRAKRLGLKVGLAPEVERPPDLIPGNVLDDYARDLPELLRQLGMQPSRGREDQWLENRVVLNALIEEPRTQRDPIIRRQCAAWLRRASLSKVTEIQIPSQTLKSRLMTALEVLAGIASDPAEHALVRVLAKSVLAKDEFVLQLWKSHTEYVSLVYEHLLAMDRRLFSTKASPGKLDWYVVG